MAKTPESNRAVISLDLYWRGKRRKPSVSLWFSGDDEKDVNPLEADGFDEFHKAAYEFCKRLIDAGELD